MRQNYPQRCTNVLGLFKSLAPSTEACILSGTVHLHTHTHTTDSLLCAADTRCVVFSSHPVAATTHLLPDSRTARCISCQTYHPQGEISSQEPPRLVRRTLPTVLVARFSLTHKFNRSDPQSYDRTYKTNIHHPPCSRYTPHVKSKQGSPRLL